jgi:hypothetical protein
MTLGSTAMVVCGIEMARSLPPRSKMDPRRPSSMGWMLLSP